MLIYIMFGHWVGDFVLQHRWMGENKSHNLWALLAHAAVYGFTLFVWVFMWRANELSHVLFAHVVVHSMKEAAIFAFVNAFLHASIDAVTSRITHKLWNVKNVWGFFTVIGLDQFIHFACLVWTMHILQMGTTL